MRARRGRLISFQVEAVGPATSNRDVGQREAQQNHEPTTARWAGGFVDTIPDCTLYLCCGCSLVFGQSLRMLKEEACYPGGEVTENKSLATSLLSDKPTLTLCDYIGETEKGRTECREGGRDEGETEGEGQRGKARHMSSSLKHTCLPGGL